MALQKQAVPINFSRGIDSKADRRQVELGKFLDLQNSVFGTLGQLKKRNGYERLATLPATDSTYLTTFNGNLTAIGNTLYAYSESTNQWSNKGSTQPLDLNTLSLVKNATNQSTADIAIAANGLVCVAYTDNIPVDGVLTAVPKYSILDSTTGQNIVPPTVLAVNPAIGTPSPKAFVLGNYFIVVFSSTVSGSPRLQYIAISTAFPDTATAPDDISTTYSPSTNVSWDGVVVNNSLFIAYNGSDLGGAVRYTALSSTLIQQSTKVVGGFTATTMSLCGDLSVPNPVIYASFHDNVVGDGYTLAFNTQLQQVLAPTQIIAPDTYTIANIASLANNGVCTVDYEVENTYSYDSSIFTDYIASKTVTQGGTVSSETIIARGVGLASKAFSWNGLIHFLAAYNSALQPTYFLMNQDGEVISKLAYSNGGGYNTMGIPNATMIDDTMYTAYLFRDRIQAVNKSIGGEDQLPASNFSGGIYAQTGVSMAKFTFGVSSVVPAEIGEDLHLTGGFLWMYDGVDPVEHGFHLYPDYVEGILDSGYGALSPQQYFYVAVYEWGDNQGNIFRSAPSIPDSVNLTTASQTLAFNAEFETGDTVLSVSDTTNIVVGQVLTDTTTPANIGVGTYVTAVNSGDSEITISQPAQGDSALSPGDALQTVTTLINTVNVPTLRLTYKINNPVKITIYRWSTAQQTYYQITSIQQPTLNDVTVDSIAYEDTAADSSIIGNDILYTTGGVVENIAAPATPVTTIFKSRLVALDAENRNVIWFSKPVLQATPVEFSDLFTKYVAPTVAGQGSTGVMTALAGLDDKLIMFKRDAIYYMTGDGPDITGANDNFSEPTFLTSTVGCTNQQSIVFMPNGLMFQSDKGIWLLDRNLATKYIGADVEKFNSDRVVSAINIPGTNQVRFTLSSGVTLMYDYYYDQWATFTGVPAVASTLYQNLHTFVNERGELYREIPGRYVDGSAPVLLSFETSWINLAGLQGYERVYFFYLLGTYLSQHRLSISISYDYNESPTQSILITPDNISTNWGDAPVWGAGTWGGSDNVEQWRVFVDTQKCQAFKIKLQEVQNTEDLSPPDKAGLTLSGLNLVVGLKKGYPVLKASRSVG